MRGFSEFFRLDKSQPELDFVNVPIDEDIPLFIDPFAVSVRLDRWSMHCHATLVSFFERVVGAIRAGNDALALGLLGHLREPNETRFGYSQGRPRGAGIGDLQARQLFGALRSSSAVRTGFLQSLEECELLIEGISRDKMSDLATNIIRRVLAEYTKHQCDLWDVPTEQVALPAYYAPERSRWESRYFELPCAGGGPILLVPKAIARYDPSYDHQRYYRRFVLDYLQSEHLDANSSLVQTLKNGRRVVYKKALEAEFPCTKQYLFEFSREHPEVLREYREEMEKSEKRGEWAAAEPQEERRLAAALAKVLGSVDPGSVQAPAYHRLMIGMVEFLFFPDLLNPRKEQEIHEGRKRIDIAMENGAQAGAFWNLHGVKKLPCAFVAIECKNYTTEIANPELDQITGRFSPNRGKFGIICCRRFEDRALFIRRCRDTLKDDRGLVVPLDDHTVKDWLSLIQHGRRDELDARIAALIAEVWLA